jgi:hypothetical protein
MYKDGEISIYLRNDINYKKEDIDRWVNMLMPDKIQFPEAFLLLGSLVGVAIGIRHTESEQRWAAQGIATLSTKWSKYNPPPMSDQTASIPYRDSIHNQFVGQVQTMAGLVHMHYGAIYGPSDLNLSEQSYYDKGPVYDE